MKTLIIYQSIHKGNTELIAKKIAEILGADIKRVGEVKFEDLAEYDLVGFGSGIYAWRFHVAMQKFIKNLPDMSGKKAFVFSTHGIDKKGVNKNFIDSLSGKGFEVVADFDCLGYDNWGPFKVVGGLNKGRPNEDDIAAAASFAESFKN